MKKSLWEFRDLLTDQGLMSDDVLADRYWEAAHDRTILDYLGLDIPNVTDLSETFRIARPGRLRAVRMDLNRDVDNHKKHTVAGMILREVLKGSLPKEHIDTLVDGGNYNSAKSVSHYTRLFGLNGVYVMSRLFPEPVLDLLRDDHFSIIKAPERFPDAIEREFYQHIVELMKDRNFRKNKFPLWHIKYAGQALYPFGRQIAEHLDTIPDYTVSSLGAGSTLEGLQIAVQDEFPGTSRIIVAEHELSPLFAKFKPTFPSQGAPRAAGGVHVNNQAYFSLEELPHFAIGPHYHEINHKLSPASIERIAAVAQFTDDDWKQTQLYLERKGLSVGNSSAGNLAIAANLADQGHDVLTVIYEPCRSFYKA